MNHQTLASDTWRIFGLSLMLIGGLTLANLAADVGDLFDPKPGDKTVPDKEITKDKPDSEPEKPDDADQPGPSFELTLSGSHTGTVHIPTFAYPDFGNFSGPQKAPLFESDLGLDIVDGDVNLVSHWLIGLSPDTSASTNQLGDWSKLARVNPLENAIYWNPDHWRFGLGYQFFAWGTADKRNPTDNINPRDYSAGLNPTIIPVLAVSAKWYISDNLNLEGVYVPFAQPDIYPVDVASRIPSSVTSNVSYSQLKNDPSSFVAGGRLGFTLPSIDFSFSYLYDFDHFFTPAIITRPGTIAGLGAAQVVSGINLERKRMQRIGADMKATIESLAVWLEAALNITEDPWSNNSFIRNPSLAWTAGFDLSYGPNASFYLNVQYTGEYVFNYDRTQGSDYNAAGTGFIPAKATDPAYMQEFYNRSLVQKIGGQNQGLLQGLSLNLKWSLADSVVTPQLTAAYLLPLLYDTTSETRFGALVLKPQIEVAPIDALHITVGADLAYAWRSVNNGATSLNFDTDSVGMYTSGNNVWLAVEYSWNQIFNK